MKINYDNKIFSPVSNTSNGEVSSATTFHYHQSGQVLHATYSGGEIVQGHLIALVDEEGVIDMRYHHLNRSGELQTGICRSVPELLPDGRIRLHETWRWTSGDASQGNSIVEELPML